MKRRLLLFLFAAIAGTLTALSDDYIWISGHKMSFDSSWAKDYTYFTDASSGSVKWDASTRTLTLNNFVVDRTYVNYLYSGTKDCIVFYSKRSVTIELQGNNKLYTPYRYTLALQGNTTFTGDGFLCISNGDNKKPCIDMLEEDLTITFDGPRFTLEARNSGIRGKNNTGTLRFKAGEMTVKPLNMLSNNRIVSDLGNIIFDYGMGIKMYGVYYNKAKHCMMGSKDEELIGGCVDFGPIEYYGFAICGTWITKYNCDNIEKFVTSIRSGSVKYDPDENYLRLDNVTLLNGTTAPTILNENNKYLHIGFRGKNTFQFEGERGRWAMNLKENTDISGGQLDVIGADYAGIHVGSDKSLYLKNVTLNIPFMKGGNLNSRLYLESRVEINATGNTDIGTLGWLQVQEYGDQHDVAVESNMSQPRFFWNAARVPGVYANLNELAKGPVHISTKAKSYPVDICGQGVNALNKNNIINQYLKSGRIYYDDEGLHLYNAELDYDVDDFDDMTDPALKFYSDSHIYLEGTNKIKCNDVEAIEAFKGLTIQNYASYASLTIEGPNAEIYTSGTLGLIDTKVTAPRISSEKLNVHGSWFNVTRKLGADKVSLSEEKVASTPDAPAYYDSEKQQIVAPKGPVSFLPSSEVTVYDGIQFCGEEINSANHTCVMNKYVDEGSLSVEKVSNGYTVSMHGITVKSENDVDIFNFTSLGTVGLNLYGHFNIFDTKGHFIKGDAKNIYIYGKEKDGVENCLMVEGSSTSNAGAVSVAANSSLYIYKGDANNLYVSVPRIYGQGTTSKLYVNDPYLYVRGFQRGTVSNITCAMTNSKVELYNTSSSPREIRSDGIYENGSLCTGEVKFVGKGESYIPVKRIEVDHRSWTFDTKGQTLQLKATVLPEDATNKKVYWRSGDEAVAKVDQNGKVTAISRGSASIFAYAEETIDQDEESPNSARRKSLLHPNANACVVHVIIPDPYDITLSETDVLIDRESIGGFYLTANLTPDNAETDYFEWESSDETLVTVLRNSGKTALVRRVGDEGQATITVKTANGLSASCNVTVHYPITPITVQFAQRTYTLTEVGEQLKLEPIVTPENCEKLSFVWNRYGEAISLSNDGTVTALRNGSAVVECWACYDGQQWAPGEVRINVEIPPTPVIATGLKLSPSSSSPFYSLGERLIMTPDFTPEDVTNQQLVWYSTNESVATVDENGFVTIVGWGDCEITATTTDGSRITARQSITAIDPSTLPEPVYATGISITEKEVTLMRGEEARIGVTIEPANYTENVMMEPLEGDISIAEVREEWDWSTNQTSIYIRSQEWSEQFGDMKWVIRPSAVDWEKLNAMGIWEEPRDTITIHVLAPIIFAEASPEDISITYHVTDINDKTCEVYPIYNEWASEPDPDLAGAPLVTPAVDVTATGKLTVPARANGYWVTAVKDRAFQKCSGLTEIEFSEGIETIGDEACYRRLFSLERVTLPSTIKELGNYCFSAHTSDYVTSGHPSGRNFIREVNIKSFTPPTGQNGSDINWTGAFQSVAADAVLFVPTGALANYNVQPWTEWFSRIEEKAFFEDEDAIREVESSKLKVESSWFDLSGRKLAGKPTKAGLYINGGKKIVISKP